MWELAGIDWSKVSADVAPWLIIAALLIPRLFSYLSERATNRERRRAQAAQDEGNRHEREVAAVEDLSHNTLSILTAVNGMSNRLFRSETRLEHVGVWIERLALVLGALLVATIAMIVYRDILNIIRRKYRDDRT